MKKVPNNKVKKGKKYKTIIEIIKVKGGLPTVIQVAGERYVLEHKDHYKK